MHSSRSMTHFTFLPTARYSLSVLKLPLNTNEPKQTVDCGHVCLPVNLMGLLKWRDNPKGLESYLRLFRQVDGEEIVKVS